MNAPVRLRLTGAKSRDSTHSEAWLAWMAGSFVSLINACFLQSIMIQHGQSLSPFRSEPCYESGSAVSRVGFCRS
jgi:hypothetical protein